MSRLTVQPAIAHQIAEGRVTQYRRPVNNRRVRVVRRVYVGGSTAHTSKPWTPTDGDVLAVIRSNDTARPPTPRCHVEITGHRREAHGQITTTDAQACGHDSLAGHARAWIHAHDRDWLWTVTEDRRRPEHVLADAAQLLDDQEAHDRFAARWATREVWVLELRVVAVPDVFLAPAGRMRGADEHGRTRSEAGSIDGAAAVDADELSPRWLREAQQRHHDERGRTKPPGNRKAA